MTTESGRSRASSASRAEARRRARLAAQGFPPTQDEPAETAAVTPGQPGGGFLRRMFPPAAPLPGKPDPLIGFTYTGRMRSVVSTLWLLARRPLVWIAFGVLWAASYLATNAFSASPIGVVASLGTFATLVACGWIGWQRPWAYGAAAAAVGQLIYGGVLTVAALNGTDIDGPQQAVPVVNAIVSLFVSGIFMTAIGALAGFYGGYLRRRLAEPRAGRAVTRRR
jgi:hypothetical protein